MKEEELIGKRNDLYVYNEGFKAGQQSKGVGRMKDEVESKLLKGCGERGEDTFPCGEVYGLCLTCKAKLQQHYISFEAGRKVQREEDIIEIVDKEEETKQMMLKKFEELIDALMEKTTCINCSEEYEYVFSICRYNIRELKSKLKELGE